MDCSRNVCGESSGTVALGKPKRPTRRGLSPLRLAPRLNGKPFTVFLGRGERISYSLKFLFYTAEEHTNFVRVAMRLNLINYRTYRQPSSFITCIDLALIPS